MKQLDTFKLFVLQQTEDNESDNNCNCFTIRRGPTPFLALELTCFELSVIMNGLEGRRRIDRPPASPDIITLDVFRVHVCDLYSSSNIIRVIRSRRLRWVRHVAWKGDKRGTYRVLVERPEGKKPLGRSNRRWEDNIEMDYKEAGWRDIYGVDRAQDRDRWRALVNAVMNLRLRKMQGIF